jgi:membrane-associated PAP2 superfamily phosphatase
VEFGGHFQFRHISNPGVGGPPERGGDGQSFPSGHVSIAIWTSAFYLLLRDRRPRLAAAALCGTLAFGAVVSFTRMAAGRHFLSDVVWSGIITFTATWLLYPALLLRPAFSWTSARRPVSTGGLTRLS